MKTLILMVLFLTPILAQAGDAEAGKSKAAICAACHGSNGIGIADMFPNLAGQKEGYLITSMKAYRDGERTGSSAALMVPMAANLSDEDIEDLAAYFARLGN